MPQLIHTLDSHVSLFNEGIELFQYVYRPTAPALESPRPYFHPLRTLKGKIVSGYRPHDHRWHHGLSLTSAFLSGQNFWGGPTFVDGEYRQLENKGWQLSENHKLGFADEKGQEPGWAEVVDWRVGHKSWLSELRRHQIKLYETGDFWSLKIHSRFTARKDKPLIWGSPTTQGRENAGYGGLFWRGPREFIGGKILMSDGREGADLMGQTSPWLAYIGQHDETDNFSTLIFVDDSQNLRHPTPWFVRNSTPMVCPNFAFHEEYHQAQGETLELKYHILIADGAWSREQIEAQLGVRAR